MKAATTNGALRIAEKATVSGHSPLTSPLRIIIANTWPGATKTVPSHARPRDRKPMPTQAMIAAGSPIVQNAALSHASLRPVSISMPNSSATPVAKDDNAAVRASTIG